MFSHTDLTRIDLIGSRPPPLSFGLHRIAPFQPLSAPTADSNVSATTPCHSLRIQDNRKDLQVCKSLYVVDRRFGDGVYDLLVCGLKSWMW